ncbi:acyl-CoA dehydrogenase family protein [Streptomyces sp. NPDC046716]|uniref:acyl-CoA dehydrogenase family protein n=1 Tax=Streptomyces sp. NPDC046716 TaxID=3157093 RepID=UPI0033C35523
MTTAPTTADSAEAAVQERIARLEFDLAGLDDPGNPLGAQQFLAADERRQLLPAAERLLDAFGLNAEFVPRELGGRLDRLDALARVLRAVFRRDAALGLGYGLTSFLAAVAVWTGGSTAQRRHTADLLLAGHRMACAYPEPPQGNAFLRNRLTARSDTGGYRLTGRKEAVNNAAGARALVLFAPGPEGPSAFLAPGVGTGDGLTLLPRRTTAGVRGCVIQGLAFDGWRLADDALLGPAGTGLAQAEAVFPLTRGAGLSMALGCADTALRTATAFARSRHARSSASLHTASTRAALVHAFADLLVCDCLSLVATRAPHLLPAESRTLGAVAKYLLPTVLNDMMDDLSIVLGVEAYAGGGSYGTFRKIARDLPMIGLGSAGTSASRTEIVAQLLRVPSLAPAGDPDRLAALFRPFDAALPPWTTGGTAADCDSLLDSVARTAEAAAGECGQALAEAAGILAVQARLLREACAELTAGPADRPISARAYALADRYALVVAGAACLGVWRHRPGSGFLSAPAWAAMALTRVACRLDKSAARRLSAGADELLTELLHRFDDARSYDLYATALGR